MDVEKSQPLHAHESIPYNETGRKIYMINNTNGIRCEMHVDIDM